MKLEEFITLFAEQFDDTSADVFTRTTDYKSLDEWSSLVALSVISMVDEEYDKQLTGAELRQTNTIEELYNLIEAK
jgi:acyl carrier protein